MAQLALLIISAMLLINVVLIQLAEKHIIQTKLQTGRLLLEMLGQKVSCEMTGRNSSLEKIVSDPLQKKYKKQQIDGGENQVLPFACILLLQNVTNLKRRRR